MEVFECFVCSALDVMLAPLGVIPNGLPRTEVEDNFKKRPPSAAKKKNTFPDLNFLPP